MLELVILIAAFAAIGGFFTLVFFVLDIILRLIYGWKSASKAYSISLGVIAAVCIVTYLITFPISRNLVEQRNASIQSEATRQGFTLSSVMPAQITIVGDHGCLIYAVVDNNTFTLAGQPDSGPLTPADITQLCK
jgi:hypothetical protein